MNAIARAFRAAACSLVLLPSLARPAEPAAGAPPRIEPDIAVQVDARVEIAATMARLAGLEEYQARGIAAYDRAVDAHFAPYRARRAELAANPGYVDQVLRDGAVRARATASAVLQRARQACGLA